MDMGEAVIDLAGIVEREVIDIDPSIKFEAALERIYIFENAVSIKSKLERFVTDALDRHPEVNYSLKLEIVKSEMTGRYHITGKISRQAYEAAFNTKLNYKNGEWVESCAVRPHTFKEQIRFIHLVSDSPRFEKENRILTSQKLPADYGTNRIAKFYPDGAKGDPNLN